MKRLTAVPAALCACVLLGGVASAATPRPVAERQLCRRLYLFETAWTHADFKTLERLLAPGYIHTDDHGNYQPRGTWLKVMHRRSAELKTLTVRMRDVRIRLLGRTAVATGEMEIHSRRTRGMPPELGRFTQVWVDNPSGWQRLAFQLTPEIKRIRFSDMRCSETTPAVCKGRVTVSAPAPWPRASAAGSIAPPAHGCTFVGKDGRARKREG